MNGMVGKAGSLHCQGKICQNSQLMEGHCHLFVCVQSHYLLICSGEECEVFRKLTKKTSAVSPDILSAKSSLKAPVSGSQEFWTTQSELLTSSLLLLNFDL